MRRHVRVFRIRPGKWGYLVTGCSQVPFLGVARTQPQALRRGWSWLKFPEPKR